MSWAMFVQCPRHQFFTGTGLTINQHTNTRAGQAANCSEYLLHRWCLTDDFGAQQRWRRLIVDVHVAQGAELDVFGYLTSRYFGTRYFGSLFGCILLSLTLGSGLGHVGASMIFDATGSYSAFMWVTAIVGMAASFAESSLAVRYRERHPDVPLVLMGYANPMVRRGPEWFANAAAAAGVDGVICVDIPPEEDPELGPDLRSAGIDLIRLATPTTDTARLPAVLNGASGYL